MPRIQFKNWNNEIFDGVMPTPKRIQELKAWYRGARAAIPRAMMPELSAGVDQLICPKSHWLCEEHTVSESYITFKLLDSISRHRALLVIQRTRGAF